MTAKRVASRAESFGQADHDLVCVMLQDFLQSIHWKMPLYPHGDIVELFRIPAEAEDILRNPSLVEYFSGGNFSSRELLRRCNGYLDTQYPTSSLFSSLHFTWSIWSTLTVTENDIPPPDSSEMATEGIDESSDPESSDDDPPLLTIAVDEHSSMTDVKMDGDGSSEVGDGQLHDGSLAQAV